MGGFKMCEYASQDGTYRIPFIQKDPAYQFFSIMSPFFYRQYEVVKIICNEGETSVKGFEFELHMIGTIDAYGQNKIFAGIYKVGERNPIWHRVVKGGDEYKDVLEFKLGGLELPCGRYFILLGNVLPNKKFTPFIKEFAGCYRFDFSLLPHGQSLPSPRLSDCAIRYIAPHERKSGFRRHYPSYLMMVGDFPLYELTVSLDHRPNPDTEKFDLRIFDEGLLLMETIEDICQQQSEQLSFVPPHGIPHGKSHFVLYHNDRPFVHLQCNGAKKMKAPLVEYISGDSIYYHLHKHKSLQLYGCKAIKKKILSSLNNPDVATPDYLCLIDDSERSVHILSHIMHDLYPGMPLVNLFDSDLKRSARDFRAHKVKSRPSVIIWDLYRTSRNLWNKWIPFLDKNITPPHKLVIYGAANDVDALFEKFGDLSRLFPARNRWKTQPLTKMESLYCMVDAFQHPCFKEYERLYQEVMRPRRQ